MRHRFAPYLPSLPALVLYALTIAVELPVIFIRTLVAAVTIALLLLLTGHSAADWQSFLKFGVYPTVWAIFALITAAGGGWWWRQNMGGREPSGREQLAYADALALLAQQTSTPLPKPSSWFVIDTPQLDAAVNCNALMLSRGLLESEYLPAVVAHELGHLATTDGKLTAALNRLIIHPPPRPTEEERQQQDPRGSLFLIAPDGVILTLFGVRALVWLVRRTVSFAKGGLGLRITAPAWGVYWRQREYAADQYAAVLGQADELADFLEIHALIHDHPVPFMWLTEHTHPATELRVDRLRNFAHADKAALLPSSNGHHPDQPQILAP